MNHPTFLHLFSPIKIRGEANVVIADWRCDWVGFGVAEMLARSGCHVRFYRQGTRPGQNL